MGPKMKNVFLTTFLLCCCHVKVQSRVHTPSLSEFLREGRAALRDLEELSNGNHDSNGLSKTSDDRNNSSTLLATDAPKPTAPITVITNPPTTTTSTTTTPPTTTTTNPTTTTTTTTSTTTTTTTPTTTQPKTTTILVTNSTINTTLSVNVTSSLPNITTTEIPLMPNCGAFIDGEEVADGILATPNYPRQYENGLFCQWTIQGGKGKRVHLEFEDFDVTGNPGCEGDYLAISTIGMPNDTDKIIACGSDKPEPILSERDILYLEFRSTPHGDTCRGFSARYTMQEVVATCGDEVSFLEFDFENPEYPETRHNTTDHCELTISHDCEVPICQLRLDFIEFDLQPPEFGNCDLDQMMVRANEPVPTLCGSNNGQHIYVDVKGRSSTSLHILTSPIYPKPVGHFIDPHTGYPTIKSYKYETENNRKWKVRVNQIPCDCRYDVLKAASPRAPTGCLQYHEGVRENVKSFNFEGTKLDYNPCWNGTETECGRKIWTGHLNSLDYHVCIRQAEGYCGVMYSPTSTDSFLVTGEAKFNSSDDRTVENLFGTSNCQADYVVIPKGRTPGDDDPWAHDRFCGLQLGNYVEGNVVSYSTPFYVHVKTDADEFSKSIDLENRGFELTYTQLPCSGPYMFNSDQKYSGR